jgi:chromosome segregation ATPase
MAEKISDDKFKSEVMRFIEVANQKFDGLTTDVRTNGYRLDKLDARFDKLDAKLEMVSGRQNDVIPKVIGIQKTVNRISDAQAEQTFKMIEMVNRLDSIERHLKSLDERAKLTESEVKDIRGVINSLVDPVLSGSDLRASISEIDQRITNIEEKLAA